MTTESNVGARIFLIGKDATLSGLAEIQAAVAKLNAQIAAGATSSKAAAAGMDEEAAATGRLNAVSDLYKANLAAVNVEQDALARVGKAAFFGMTAAAAVWGYESIKWAQNYQTALVQLRTQAGLTVGAMNQIGAAAMKNAANLGVTPTEYLQAAYHPASTGFNVATTIAITNWAARLAQIGSAPTEDTVNALTGVMKSYKLSGNTQAEQTAATLNAIVGAGNMHFSDLNSALGSGVASIGQTYGVSLPALGGALAYLTDRGVPASQAGTHLRMSLSLLGAPTGESAKLLTAAGMGTTQATAASSAMASALTAAGLSTTQVSAALRDNSGAGGIYNALNLLKTHLQAGGLSQPVQADLISRAFGGGRMGTTIEQMYANLPQLASKTAQIDKNGTTSKLMQDWDQKTQTLDFQLKRLGATVETLGTQFGNALLPPLTEAIKLFTDMLGFLDRNKAVAIGLGSAIMMVLVPAIGVYLYRSLLSSGGAIRTVIGAYSRLITGQSLEGAAMAKTQAQLAALDTGLVGNDAALGTNAAAARGDAGAWTTLDAAIARGAAGTGAGGAAAAAGGKAAGAGGLAAWLSPTTMALGGVAVAGAVPLSQLVKGGAWPSGLDPKALVAAFPHGYTAADLASVHGTNLSSTTSKLEALSDEYILKHPQGFSQSEQQAARGFVVHNHITVELDGKQVSKAVTKTTKATVARSN